MKPYLVTAVIIAALAPARGHLPRLPEKADHGLARSLSVVSTSEAGDRLTEKGEIVFSGDADEGVDIIVRPDLVRQQVEGIGSSLTESSAFVLAHLSRGRRREVLERTYGSGGRGAGFSLARTHIGSCDFSVEGRYSYLGREDAEFSIEPDKRGFRDSEAWPGVMDRGYDLLPMIKEALEIAPDLRIIASPWTAPPWMKDIGDWFIKGYADADGGWHEGTGGRLLEEYYPAYARYIRRYIDSYADEGVAVWAVTPVNEPNGNGGNWESMHWDPAGEALFIRDHLGPVLEGTGVRILAYDQNRGDELKVWADGIYADEAVAEQVYGMAVHWYSSTVDSRTESLDYTHERAPGKTIFHTEGCIDNLGLPAPAGIADPEGYKESGWWKNDAFWWNDCATDWGYTAMWGDWIDPADHPKYTPVHRYARDIIDSMNHRVNGWVDWNVVLDRHGGPNHVGNFCGAPVMIDIDAEEPDEEVYYTPVFYILSQLSRSIKPGDRVVESRVCPKGRRSAEGLRALATVSGDDILSINIFNPAKDPVPVDLRVGVDSAAFMVDANSLLTLRLDLGGR